MRYKRVAQGGCRRLAQRFSVNILKAKAVLLRQKCNPPICPRNAP